VAFLNYHHLRYFYVIATEGGLHKAAERLRLSPSALSVQLRRLEESLGRALFDRTRKGLSLTEEGRLAMDYAETIFGAGDELLQTLANPEGLYRRPLRIGSVATLSRNFQMDFLRPALEDTSVEVVVRTGALGELLAQLGAHVLDLVLSNQPARSDEASKFDSALIDEQAVSLVGKKPRGRRRAFRFPEDLDGQVLALPTREAAIRAAFDTLMRRAGVKPLVAAEVDDMPMLRLIARSLDGLTLAPPVVVQDELRRGELVERWRIGEIRETFYAITAVRRYPNPALKHLLEQGARS